MHGRKPSEMFIKVLARPYACFYLVFELLEMLRTSLLSIRVTIATKITSQVTKTTPSTWFILVGTNF